MNPLTLPKLAFVTAVLAAAPALAAPASSTDLTRAVYAYPLITSWGVFANRLNFGFGAALPLGENRSLVLETSGLVKPPDDDSVGPVNLYRRLVGSAGVAFSMGDGPLRGLTFQPKVSLAYFSDVGNGGVESPLSVNGDGVEVALGLDVSYQLQFGNFYVAPVLGASGGYCFNCTTRLPPNGELIALPFEDPQALSRSNRWVLFRLNLNLLRAGFTW
jgi:hypothetical protein